MSCCLCTLLKYFVPMSYAALRISNWSICSTFPNHTVNGVIFNFFSFFTRVLINKSMYLIFHPVITTGNHTLPTGNWGVRGVQLQVGNAGCPENSSPWFLLLCLLPVTGFCCTAQTLQRNYPSTKLTHWAYWGSNTTIRQITYQFKPDSISSIFTEEQARSFTSIHPV